MADTRIGLALNLKNNAASQYIGFNFNSMCRFGDKYLGVNEDGLFTLDDADTDNGTDIDAIVELPTSNLGHNGRKFVRFLYCGYEANGSLTMKIQTDEGSVTTKTLEARTAGNKQHRSRRLAVGRNTDGYYLMFRIENVDGCDFSVDRLDALVIPLNIGR